MFDRLWHWVYEAGMIILAIATVYLAIQPETDATHLTIQVIWAVFVVDYGVRLLLAPSKRAFIRNNVLDLVAILPWDLLRATRLLRLLRLLRILRGFEVLWRVSETVRGILGTNKLGQVIVGTATFIFAGGLLITHVEPGIGNLPDGLWWSLVTATGYGDFTPETPEGRIIAALLMLVGIGTIGMMTASIATYFLGTRGTENRHVQHLQRELDRWDELAPRQRRELACMLRALAENQGEPEAAGGAAAEERATAL